VWRRVRQPTEPTEPDASGGPRQGETETELEAQALKAIAAAEAHWRSILRTLRGPQDRLRELAGAAQNTAAALRQGDSAGLQRGHPAQPIPANWQPPHELQQGAPRPGPTAAWQALDRAFKSLVAALNDPSVALPDLALAWDTLANAAGGLADAIDHASVQQRAVCSFCAKPAREVRRLITGPPGVGICNECVDLCVEILEEDG